MRLAFYIVATIIWSTPKLSSLAPGPQTLVSGPGALQNRSRTRLNASGVFLASNLQLETVKIMVKSTESKHVVIVNILGDCFASISGRTHFRTNV